jgi:hypothetical protein
MKRNNLVLICAILLANVNVVAWASSSANSATQAGNKTKPSPLRDITYSCSNEYVKAESIKILWSEANYNLPISVLDGFNSETCIGKVSKTTFTWDRGTSSASLDRRTGALTIKPKKDGVSISLKCTFVE